MLRPFPLPLRIGIDICKIDRIKGIVAPKLKGGQNGANTFAKKILTARELRYFQLRFLSPQQYRRDVEGQKVANYLAGRWAAKEACVKAVKPRKITLSEIEIWPDENMETYAIILDQPPPTEQITRSTKTTNVHPIGHDHVKDDESQMLVHNEKDADVRVSAEGHANRHIHPLDDVPSHDSIEGQVVKISLTHDTDYACAVALYAAPEPSGAEQSSPDTSTEQRLTNIEKELMKLRRAQGQRIAALKYQ